MAQVIWKPTVQETTTETGVVFNSEGASLTKLRNGLGSIWGEFPTDGAIVTFASHTAKGITEMLGFKADVLPTDEATSGSVNYQVSFEGGNWQYWTGAVFQDAASNEWNTDVELSVGLSVTDSVDEIRFRALISPGLTTAPTFRNIQFNCELSYDFEEDVYRTLRRWVQDRIAARLYYKEVLIGATDKVTIQGLLEVKSVVNVYNLTNDPTQSVNIFDSLNGDEVTMTAVQDAGEMILVIYLGTTDVFITAEPESHAAELPVVVVQILNFTEYKPEREEKPLREYLGDHVKIGLRTPPARMRFDVVVNCLAQRNSVSIALANSVSKMFKLGYLKENKLTAIESGEVIDILNLQPIITADDVTERLFRKMVRFTGATWDWGGTILETLDTIETIYFDTGTTLGYLENLEVQ